MGKTEDESISDIQFCTTPKGDLLNYSYIFMNPEPLRTERNNVDCSRLWTMLHPDIQKGKEDTKTSTGEDDPQPIVLATLEKLMKDWPVDSYIAMKSGPIVPGGRPLMEVVYMYNNRKFQGFIANGGAGSTEPDNPYLSHFPDIYYNVSVCPDVCPHLMGRYFNSYSAIENHNMIYQSDLAL